MLFTKLKKIGTYSTPIGKWAIKLNREDVLNGVSNNIEIPEDYLIYEPNDNILEDKIAPNGSAYFDIEVDGTNTDVSILGDLTMNTERI